MWTRGVDGGDEGIYGRRRESRWMPTASSSFFAVCGRLLRLKACDCAWARPESPLAFHRLTPST